MEHIYTIGYGKRDFNELAELLIQYGIQYVIDIRSKPFSRVNSSFSRPCLQSLLKQSGLGYVFMGDELGGRPPDRDCYVDGKVQYRAVTQKPYYQHGIDRLLSAARQGIRVCLLCSEARPETCHRSKLVGETLDRLSVPVLHIDPDGSAHTQQQVISRITNGQLPLIEREFSSRKRYVADN